MAISFGEFSRNKYMQYESFAKGYRQAMKNAKDKQTFQNNKNELLKVRKMHWEKLKKYYQNVVSDPTGNSALELQEAKEWLKKVTINEFTKFDRQQEYKGK